MSGPRWPHPDGRWRPEPPPLPDLIARPRYVPSNTLLVLAPGYTGWHWRRVEVRAAGWADGIRVSSAGYLGPP